MAYGSSSESDSDKAVEEVCRRDKVVPVLQEGGCSMVSSSAESCVKPGDVSIKTVSDEHDKVFHFKKPTTENELENLGHKRFVPATDRKVSWAVGLFKEWRLQRMKKSPCAAQISWCNIDDPTLTKGHLCYCLCAFLNEVVCRDGEDFPGKTIHKMVILIQFYLEGRGIMWKLMEDPNFVRLKYTVDNLMKEHARKGVSGRVCASPISTDEEEVMWSKNIFGEDTPTKLRDTVLYLLGLGLALRGG